MGLSPKEQPKYVFGKENEHYVPKPAVSNQANPHSNNWDTRKKDYLDKLRGEFITDRPYSPEQDALDVLRDREPDEVPEFPEGTMSPTVLSEYARHAISSAYARSGKQHPDNGKDENPPQGSDGGRVVTAEGVVAGYGWENENGEITSLVSLDGTIVSGPGAHKEKGE